MLQNDELLSAGGEMGERMRTYDWSAHPLGPPRNWPQALRTSVRLMLTTNHPVFIFWGPQLYCFYNDAYRASMGTEKHPAMLGALGRSMWEEIWPIIGPQIDQVMSGGGSTWHEDQLVPIFRNGRLEDVYWTYGYSPIDHDGGIGGVLVLCTETTARVLSDQQGARDNRRWSEIFSQSPSFVAILRGREHRFELVNEAYQRLVGHRDVIGQTVREALPDIAMQGFFELLDEVFTSGQRHVGRGQRVVFQVEPDVPVSEHFVDFIYQPMRDGSGNIDGIFVEGYDVTETRRAEDALMVSEESLRLAVEAADIGTWDLDLTTDVLTWSDRTKAAFGFSPDASCSMDDFYAGLHPDDREATTVAFASAIDPTSRATYDVEYRTVGREDRIVRWVAAKGRGIFNDDGKCVRAIGTAIDVTARKRDHQRLRELNETLERRVADAITERQVWADLLEGSDDPVAAVDSDLRFIAMNQAYRKECERLFGVQFSIGESLPELLAPMPAARDAAIALWSRALAGETVNIAQSGEESEDGAYYDLRFRPLTNREGVSVGAFQFSRNVTERVRAQRRLHEAQEALRQSQKMEAVGQLTGGIAHDFNNMLAVVLGSLDLLARRIGSADARAKRYADAATEAGKRAATLTQRLLAFSRQQPLQPEAVNPNRLVAGMSDLLTHSLGGAIVIETVLAAGVWRTNADPNQLENAILNLAVNARDAMPEGGKLTIETQNALIDERYSRANPGVAAGQYILIALTDTGEGMPPDVIAKAFDPFFTTKTVGRGTGLGLSQVYGFVKQSGGHIKIYSEAGMGTTIKIYLPRLTTEAGDADVAEVEVPLLLGEETELILVVEDEPAVRQFSVDALMELGYRVLEAGDAATALELLRRYPHISLLFTDVVMPEVSGKRLADEALVLRPDLKVLFTTGYTRNAVVHNGVLDEGVELIGKPFTIEALAAKLRAVLEAS